MTDKKLTAATVVEVDGEFTTTWAEFADANRDGMDEGELEEIEAALFERGDYHGGGGAFASYTLRVVKYKGTTMTKLTWKFNSADDESVDPDYALLADGKETEISVQDASAYRGGYSVNEMTGTGYDTRITVYPEHQTLKAAKAEAEALYRAKA